MDEIVILFNYKGKDILIRKQGEKYQLGIRNPKGIDVWLEQGVYNNIELARTSGREYARIVIDKMLVSRKKEIEKNYE